MSRDRNPRSVHRKHQPNNKFIYFLLFLLCSLLDFLPEQTLYMATGNEAIAPRYPMIVLKQHETHTRLYYIICCCAKATQKKHHIVRWQLKRFFILGYVHVQHFTTSDVRRCNAMTDIRRVN